MSKETIYKEDAIKALRLEYPMMPLFKEMREEWAIKTEGFRKAEEVIMRLPSARLKGKWVNIYQLDSDGRMMAQCSNCCKKAYFYGSTPNFCSNCGVDMRGDRE